MKATVWRHWLRVGLAGGALLCAPLVRADGEVPGLLFQGGIVVPPVPVVVDPRLPKGPELAWSERPTVTAGVCDNTYPVCVHGGTSGQRKEALTALRAAFVQWAYVLARTAPLPDLTLGGGPQLDVYLSTQPTPLTVERDAPLLSSDRSSGFCVLDQASIHPHWLTLCVAEVASLNLDAALGAGMRRGWAQQQIQDVSAPRTPELLALDNAQANPQAPLLTRESNDLSNASGLFWSHLDANWGAGPHGDLPFAMLTLARRQGVSLDAHPQWNSAPDLLDVLRKAFDNDAQRIAKHLVDFAVWRAFVGSRSDGTHPPDSSAWGDLGRIRFDWVISYSSLPRHLAGPYPVYPLGSAYAWVDLDSVPVKAELGFRAEWEQPVQFQWAIVRVDAQGRAMSQINLPYLERATSAEKTLLHFQGAAGLLIVGINLGAVDGSHPFDPDQEPWEPHGYSIYLTELPHK